jgi:hypothetical protein
MNATHLSTDLAVLAAAAALGACGGSSGDDGSTGDGERAVVARQIPVTVTVISHSAASRSAPAADAAGDSVAQALAGGLPALEGAQAARRECGAVVAYMVAMTHGGATNDLDAISVAFARDRAAPGARAEVRRGCRAGLHD